MEPAAFLEGTIHLREDPNRLRHVLNGDGDYRGVEALVFQRQGRVGVYIVDHPLVELRVLGHLDAIQPQSYKLLFREALRQMGAPATHQVQYHPIPGELMPEVLSYRRDRVVVYVDHEARLDVEEPVVALVFAAKELCRIEVVRLGAWPGLHWTVPTPAGQEADLAILWMTSYHGPCDVASMEARPDGTASAPVDGVRARCYTRPRMVARTLEEVIEQLEGVVARARSERSRLGFFAALYRRVTIDVKEGIKSGRFEDGPRMERFDVIFANRYLEALDRFRGRDRPSDCWLAAFEGAASRRLLVMQHLLLGMNAHINLDLGIAAARTCPGDELPGLKRDFDAINSVLAELVDEVQDRIGKVSPWVRLVDRVFGRADELLAVFSMGKARDAAWSLAERLAPLGEKQQASVIAEKDRDVEALARRIRNPGLLVSLAALAVRSRQTSDVRRIIDVLS